MFKQNALLTTVALSAAIFAAASTARAQVIYSQDFSTDDSANWVVNSSHSGSNYINFNFDYSTVGLPPAPHSVGGNTKGLKMSPDIVAGAHIGAAAVNGESASPTNFSTSENFDMHVDMWINYQGPNTANITGGSATNNFTTLQTGAGGSGSSILYGAGYGTAGTASQVAGSCDSILVGALTDTGFAQQIRMYGPAQAGSYQDFTYQSTGTIAPSFPGDQFVYNNPTGTRNFYNQATWKTVPNPNWTNLFPSIKPPQAQINLWQQQSNIQCNLGAPDFAWHDVEVQKIGKVIVYSIDGYVAATGNYDSAGTPAGSYLVFTAFDVNSNPSTDPNFAALNFVVFANIVVSNLPTVVNVTATTPVCTEGSPGSPGVFTFTRSSSGAPLTVNYRLRGTATNGVQYQSLPLSVTFAASDLSTTVSVVPIDDGISLPTTAVILDLQPGPGYAAAGSAVVNILDNDTPTIDITGGSQAYGRYTNTVVGGGNNDFIAYNLTRRGKLTTGSDLTVNLSYSGTAVSGTDYTPLSTITIPDGASTNELMIPPVDNPNVTTNRTVTVTVAAGTGYAVGVGPASGTIVPAHYDAATVILTDALTNADDATNWNVIYGTGDPLDDSLNFSADFGMSLAAAAGGISIPPPPNGNANALHLTCNKLNSSGAPGAVNAYFTNVLLSGNYAVRFNMNLIQGQVNATEGAVFGIDHSGSLSNWWYGSGFLTNQTWSSDGIWYFMTAQPGGTSSGDYEEYTGNGGTNGNTGWKRVATKSQTSFTQVFKENPGPFTASDASALQTPGVPANNSPGLGYDASTWCDVEIKQTNNVVTLSINRTPVFVFTNTTVWKSGYLMLGYADPFGSVGSPDAGVYYANLQVVQLGPTVVTINSISFSGPNVVVKFTTNLGSDTAASFSLTSSSSVNGTYNPLVSTITSLGSNQFQATTPYLGDAQQFYRIVHN
jgi:hypothetical protein